MYVCKYVCMQVQSLFAQNDFLQVSNLISVF